MSDQTIGRLGAGFPGAGAAANLPVANLPASNLPTSSLPASARAAGDATLRGMAIALLGYFVIAVSDAAVKWALPEIGVALAMVWRGAIGAATVALLVRGHGLLPQAWAFLNLRNVTQCATSCIFYYVWSRGVKLADSYAVNSAMPLLMTLLAIPMLGEAVGWRRWTSTAVGFLGVLFMLRPGGELWRWETGLLLGAVALLAVTRIWMRQLTRTESAATIAFTLMLTHIPVGLVLLPFMPPAHWAPAAGTVPVLLLLGLCTGTAHWLFSRAYGLAPVAAIAPFEYTPLLWGVGFGFLIWHELPTGGTLLGAAVVVGAGIYNLHRERVRRRAELLAAKAVRA